MWIDYVTNGFVNDPPPLLLVYKRKTHKDRLKIKEKHSKRRKMGQNHKVVRVCCISVGIFFFFNPPSAILHLLVQVLLLYDFASLCGSSVSLSIVHLL